MWKERGSHEESWGSVGMRRDEAHGGQVLRWEHITQRQFFPWAIFCISVPALEGPLGPAVKAEQGKKLFSPLPSPVPKGS